MRVSLQQALRSVPIDHHSDDLMDGDAGALDAGFSMANCRINGNTRVHVVPKQYTSKTHLARSVAGTQILTNRLGATAVWAANGERVRLAKTGHSEVLYSYRRRIAGRKAAKLGSALAERG